MPDTPPLITVTLPAYRWHKLLSEMEDAMCVCNRDQRTMIELYQDIASQLDNGAVKVRHQQNPNPAFRPTPPAPVSPPAAERPVSIWARLTGR